MRVMRFLPSAAIVVCASLMNSAFAVSLGTSGIGQVLIYPYYTVNKGQDTLISVVNASDIGKLAVIRIAEGYNGRDVLKMWLLLSPHDVWTASITQVADDDGALLRTGDHSCLYPAIPAGGQPFHDDSYTGVSVPPFTSPDGGPTSITRTREGFIKIVTIADIVPGSPTDTAISHVQNGLPNGGAPPGCADLNYQMVQPDQAPPSSGILGSAAVINVGEGIFFAYNAEALQDFTDAVISLNKPTGGDINDAYTTDAPGGAVATAYINDSRGRPLALSYPFGEDAVSAVFMADSIYNEYLTAPALGASTDWVITFPTKNFYVDPIFVGDTALPPFTHLFADGKSTVDVGGTVFDREEGAVSLSPCTLCPPVGPPPSLPYQVDVIGFGVASTAPSGVFGSNLRGEGTLNPLGDDGNVELDFSATVLPGGVDADGNAITLRGLPVIGFMAYNIINSHAQPGKLANYGGTFRHRATSRCEGNVDGCVPINSDDVPRAAATQGKSSNHPRRQGGE